MTNDNNNNNKLVSCPDDDATQIHDISRLRGFASSDVELEVDADTVQFEEPAQSDENADDSILALEAEIAQRDKCINELQFDIEQLTARRNGLDKELQSREELTAKIDRELQQAKTKLARREKSLQSTRARLAKEKKHHKTNQAELSDLKAAIQSLKKDAAAAAEQAKSNEQIELEGLRLALDEANKHSELVERENSRLLANLAARNTAVRQKNEESDSEFPNILAGQHAGAMQEIKDLRAQIARTEKYADEMRHKLKSQIKSSKEARIAQSQTASMLEAARQRTQTLNEELESERLAHASLSRELEDKQQSFDIELRESRQAHEKEIKDQRRESKDELQKLRSELATAEETIADHQVTNEQLTANLLGYKSTNHTLEEQVSKIDSQYVDEISSLKKDLRKLKQENKDLERQLENKANAISGMMSELASRSQIVEAIKNLDDDVDIDLDAPQQDTAGNTAGHKQRVSRLLIGNVDGQELQFPLFKNRLTIGRTAENDIQLETQFISRRHAVIVTEGGETRIVDWGSKNGIRVNREFVKEKFLHTGDIVTIGTADFRYEERGKR